MNNDKNESGIRTGGARAFEPENEASFEMKLRNAGSFLSSLLVDLADFMLEISSFFCSFMSN